MEVKLSAASCSENQKFDKRKEPEEQINIQSVPGVNSVGFRGSDIGVEY